MILVEEISKIVVGIQRYCHLLRSDRILDSAYYMRTQPDDFLALPARLLGFTALGRQRFTTTRRRDRRPVALFTYRRYGLPRRILSSALSGSRRSIRGTAGHGQLLLESTSIELLTFAALISSAVCLPYVSRCKWSIGTTERLEHTFG